MTISGHLVLFGRQYFYYYYCYIIIFPTFTRKLVIIVQLAKIALICDLRFYKQRMCQILSSVTTKKSRTFEHSEKLRKPWTRISIRSYSTHFHLLITPGKSTDVRSFFSFFSCCRKMLQKNRFALKSFSSVIWYMRHFISNRAVPVENSHLILSSHLCTSFERSFK